MKKSGSAEISAGQRLVEKARYLDKEGRASFPLSLLLVLLFEMRGYVAAIISLTFAEDRTRLLKLFYQFGAIWTDAAGRITGVNCSAGNDLCW